jgi:hypothetical protein
MASSTANYFGLAEVCHQIVMFICFLEGIWQPAIGFGKEMFNS